MTDQKKKYDLILDSLQKLLENGTGDIAVACCMILESILLLFRKNL